METNEKNIVYIGDFDFRNENVQSFLVKNNGAILNSLGYHVSYIGINTKITREEEIASLPPVTPGNGNTYFELPDTHNIKGVFGYRATCKKIMSRLDSLIKEHRVRYLISYQSPTYAPVLKKTAKWCRKNGVKYIVNCADLPIFDLQPFFKRIIMKANWGYLHKVNKRYADGVISVSKFIRAFYDKPGRRSVIIPPLFDETQYTLPSPRTGDIPSFIYAGVPFKTTGHEAAPEGMKDRLDKIIDLFLELSAKGVSYSFTVVGITREDYLDGVPRQRSALEKKSKIEFLGRLSHSETLALVSGSDFSINFRDENLMTKAGFSTKVVESVSLGTPVIINPISDMFDYLEEGVSGFALSGSFGDDVDKMRAVCNTDKAERLRIKIKCLENGIFGIGKYKEAMNGFLTSL